MRNMKAEKSGLIANRADGDRARHGAMARLGTARGRIARATLVPAMIGADRDARAEANLLVVTKRDRRFAGMNRANGANRHQRRRKSI